MGRLPLRRLALVCLLFLPILVFHRSLFLGEAFVPADLLGHLYPYKTVVTSPSPWNVLRFDGVTQFYPWRMEAARQWATGHIPLWNPYQFAASGGTPLLANSQSAPFYPLNFLFLLLYKLGAFWYAFGLVAAIHLLIAAKGTYHFLRSLSLGRSACLLGAITFGLSGPVITWLSLPTFLAVACWLPWLLLFIRRAHQQAGTMKGLRAGIIAGVIAGLLLLAGHLQIAFYCLLTAGLYLLWEGHFAVRLRKQVGAAKWAGALVLAGAIMVCLALPQVLPVLELSRISHRAASGPPTMDAYNGFIATAVPVRNLVTFLVPDFFGHPNRNDGFYWNNNNYTEWCGYVGVIPLMLAVFALALPWRGSKLPVERGFFAGLLALTLLLAMGTPLNLPFFFLVPGFGQLANPGRILVIVAFALSVLAAFGLQGLLDAAAESASMPKDVRSRYRRAAMVAVAAPLLLAAIGASQSVSFAAKAVPSEPFGQLMALALPGVLQAVLFAVLAIALLAVALRTKGSPVPQSVLIIGALALSLADLAIWGYDYNPSSPAKDVYPVTPGIAWLQKNAANALIAPMNQRWSLYAQRPPVDAVLPPNGLTVYGLHDVAGYDSLFRAVSKEQIKTAAGGDDPSPPENGNLVFIKTVETAQQLRAKYLIAPPVAPDLSAAGITPVYTGPDMVIYENPNGADFDPSGQPSSLPLSFVIGGSAGILGILLAAGTLVISKRH